MSQNIFANIDGPLFRAQRDLLLRLVTASKSPKSVRLDVHDRELLEGLVNLTDAIADEAHDRYGINCLLSERNRP